MRTGDTMPFESGELSDAECLLGLVALMMNINGRNGESKRAIMTAVCTNEDCVSFMRDLSVLRLKMVLAVDAPRSDEELALKIIEELREITKKAEESKLQ